MADKSIRVILQAITGQYQAGMARAATTTQAFGAQASAAGTRAGGLRTAIGGISPKLIGGAGIVAGLAAATKASISWESAFAGVRKTVDASEGEFDQLSTGLRRMSTEIPVAAGELAGVAEAAGQLGIQTDNILGFTRTMADLGETTNLSAQEAATSLARFANIVGTSQEDFDRLGSSVVDLGNNFATTEAEIVDMAMRIAGAGAQIGMTEGEILGFATALSSVGIRAQAGGTAISRVMVDIAQEVANTGDKLELLAQTAGMSAKDFARAWEDDPARALSAFIEGLDRVAESGGNVFQILEDLDMDDVRVQDALLRAAGAGDLLAESLQTGNDAWEENIALAEEAEKRYETTESSIRVLGNAVMEVGRGFGDFFAPAVDTAAGGLADVVNWLNRKNLDDPADAIPDINREVQRGQMDAYVGQLNDMAGAAKGAAGASGELAGELGNVADAGHDAAGGIAASAEEARKLADPVFALFDATQAFTSAQTALNEAIAKHGTESAEAQQASIEFTNALLDLQAAAVNGDLDFGRFEQQLARWVEQGRLTEAQAQAVKTVIDDAAAAGREYAGDYTATVELRTEGFQYLDGLDARLAQITRDRTVSVRVDSTGSAPASSSPSAGSTSGGGSGGSSGDLPGGLRAQYRAHGGPMVAGHRYVVGEEGAEQVDMYPWGGMVTPLSGTPSGGDGASQSTSRLEMHEGAIQQNFYGDTDTRMAAIRAGHELRGVAMLLGG